MSLFRKCFPKRRPVDLPNRGEKRRDDGADDEPDHSEEHDTPECAEENQQFVHPDILADEKGPEERKVLSDEGPTPPSQPEATAQDETGPGAEQSASGDPPEEAP